MLKVKKLWENYVIQKLATIYWKNKDRMWQDFRPSRRILVIRSKGTRGKQYAGQEGTSRG